MKLPRLTIEIDEKFKREVKTKACSQGKSIKRIVIELLKKWLKGK